MGTVCFLVFNTVLIKTFDILILTFLFYYLFRLSLPAYWKCNAKPLYTFNVNFYGKIL